MTKPHLCSTNVVALTPEPHTNHFRLRMSQYPRPIPISLDRMASAFVFKLSIHHQGARKRAPPLAARTGMRLAPVPSGVGGGGSSGAMKRADTKAGISPGGRRGARAATKRTESHRRVCSNPGRRTQRRTPGNVEPETDTNDVRASGEQAVWRSPSSLPDPAEVTAADSVVGLRQGDTAVLGQANTPIWTDS